MELMRLALTSALTSSLMRGLQEREEASFDRRKHRKSPAPANMKKTKDRTLVKARRKQKHQK